MDWFWFFIFAGISTSSWKLLHKKKRLKINRFHKGHGDAAKSWSICVTKKSTHLQSRNLFRPKVMVIYGKKTHRHWKLKSKAIKVKLNLQVDSFSDLRTLKTKMSAVMFLEWWLAFVWTEGFVDTCRQIFVHFNVLLIWQGKIFFPPPFNDR